jgi:hypothetical protein
MTLFVGRRWNTKKTLRAQKGSYEHDDVHHNTISLGGMPTTA